jgi:hypothetical protein
MTILFSYISNKQAAVASDGNIVRNSDDMIIADDKDKTFSLYDRKIVGAFSNNMGINHKLYGNGVDIGTVISKISKDIQDPNSFTTFVDSLINHYQDLLNSNETLGPSINERSSNILLSASEYSNGKDFQIYCLRFGFDRNENKISLLKKEGPFSGAGRWYVDPPDEECELISNSLQLFLNKLAQKLTVEQIVKKGIEIGINKSKIMKANGKFLGGKISVKATSY